MSNFSGNNAIYVCADGLPQPNANHDSGWELSVHGYDVDLFDALLTEVTTDYCVDMNRVFSTGFSYGGLFSDTLGCARAQVLRAIAPIAGANAFSPSACQGPIAAMILHGTQDTVVSYTASGIPSRDFWVSQSGCASTTHGVDPSPCVAYDGCSADNPITWCAWNGAHEVPDFAAQGIWSFFDAMK